MQYKKNLKPGEKYVVTLDNIATTGYTWQQQANNAAVTKVSIKPVKVGKAPGASGKIAVTVTALQAGHSTIVLEQVRQWEPDSPLDTCEIKIDVLS